MTKKKREKMFTREFLANAGIAGAISFLSAIVVLEEWKWSILVVAFAAAGLVFLNKCKSKLEKSENMYFKFM
jgi:hypothetical protein